MDRKNVDAFPPPLGSWDDVDQALAIIGDNQRSVTALESEMQEAIDAAKALAEAKARPYLESIKKLERQISQFAEDHREELGSRKSKTLNFGSVGFRKSTKITLPKPGPKLDEIIRRLVDRKMEDCIKRSPPTVSKEALGKYSAETIIEVGASIKTADSFWYEPAREQLNQD